MPNIPMMIIVIINVYEYLKVRSADVLEESTGSFLSAILGLRNALNFPAFLKDRK
jgi:hypothetical protein